MNVFVPVGSERLLQRPPRVLGVFKHLVVLVPFLLHRGGHASLRGDLPELLVHVAHRLFALRQRHLEPRHRPRLALLRGHRRHELIRHRPELSVPGVELLLHRVQHVLRRVRALLQRGQRVGLCENLALELGAFSLARREFALGVGHGYVSLLELKLQSLNLTLRSLDLRLVLGLEVEDERLFVPRVFLLGRPRG